MTLVPLPRGERAGLTAGLSGAAGFAACLRLFALYPLAATQRPADGGPRSMVLTRLGGGLAGLSVLTRPGEDLFAIRAWNGHDWVAEEIRPEEPVSRMTHQVLACGVPVPRDGALLGWAPDRQVTALLSVRCRQSAPGDGLVVAPEIRVMPAGGSSDPLDWPPFAASPLGDGRLWEHVERGSLVDLAPLVARRAGCAFSVPSPDRQGARYGKGCIVITEDLPDDEFWLPAGVYLDHWVLREGISTPSAARLLALPGVVDLAGTAQEGPRPN